MSGYDRLSAGIPVRDLRGMKFRPAFACASMGNTNCQFAGLLLKYYGSDGTEPATSGVTARRSVKTGQFGRFLEDDESAAQETAGADPDAR
jgi:hypothetical protein